MSFWNKSRSQPVHTAVSATTSPTLAPTFEDEGVVYAAVRDLDLVNNSGSDRMALAYLRQLEEEGYITRLVEDWLLPWEQVYQLVKSPEHRDSISYMDSSSFANIPSLTL